jgi:hypothetical protein
MNRLALALAAMFASQAHAANLSLDYLGQQIVATGFVYDGATVGGLSGIDFDAATGGFIAISDDRSSFNPARFYTLDLDLSAFNTAAAPGSAGVSFTGVITVLDSTGSAYATNSVDPESIRLSNGKLYWTSEGERKSGDLQNPFVHVMNLDGSYAGEFAVPSYYFPAGSGTTDPGIRQNLAFESLTFSNDGATLYTATENALVQDGTNATTTSGSPSRILAFDAASGAASGEFVYMVDPVAAEPIPSGSFATNGLVELLYVPGQDGKLIAVERSFSIGVGNNIKLYLVDMTGATNVLGDDSLAGDSYTAVSKELLLDLGTLTNEDGSPLLLDNIEGVTWGAVENGMQTLILVSDNNFSGTQFTQFLAFQVATVPEPQTWAMLLAGMGLIGLRARRR